MTRGQEQHNILWGVLAGTRSDGQCLGWAIVFWCSMPSRAIIFSLFIGRGMSTSTFCRSTSRPWCPRLVTVDRMVEGHIDARNRTCLTALSRRAPLTAPQFCSRSGLGPRTPPPCPMGGVFRFSLGSGRASSSGGGHSETVPFGMAYIFRDASPIIYCDRMDGRRWCETASRNSPHRQQLNCYFFGQHSVSTAA